MLISIQPFWFPHQAVLFWLNYKAAYDNWNEQRMALHKDIHMATKEVVDMLPGIQQTSAQAFGTLFLQLTVNDLGICLPITNTPQVSRSVTIGSLLKHQFVCGVHVQGPGDTSFKRGLVYKRKYVGFFTGKHNYRCAYTELEINLSICTLKIVLNCTCQNNHQN